MYVKKVTDNGIIKINTDDIVKLTQETVKMVPGVERLGSRNLREILNQVIHGVSPSGIKVVALESGKVYVECHIQIKLGTNFTDVSKQTQRIIKYTIEKQFNIGVKYVDVYIEGVI